MAAPYEILEHTADVGLLARGASMAELFEHAAAGMMEIAIDPATVAERKQKKIAVEGTDREALLVNFLQEVLWLMDGERWLAHRVAVEECSDTLLRATVFGEPRDPARHTLRIIIKAVTYHQLSVRQTPEGWRAEVYFDI